MKWIEDCKGGWDLVYGTHTLASVYVDLDESSVVWCIQGSLVNLIGFDVVNDVLKSMGYHFGINKIDRLEFALDRLELAQDIILKIIKKAQEKMNKNSAELFSVLENVVTELDKCHCLVKAAKIMEPLREYASPNCHLHNYGMTHHQKLEWYAGQLLEIADTEQWHTLNRTLQYFSLIKDLEKENR